jgi:anti-anti-sigma factor
MALETTIEQAAARVPVTIISLDGELDASNFNELIEITRQLYETGTRHLLVDMANLRFMASSGLVALHSMLRLMHGEPPPDPEAGWGALHSLGLDASGGDTQTEVQLCGPQSAVERVLTRTGLTRLFRIHPDREAALAAF